MLALPSELIRRSERWQERAAVRAELDEMRRYGLEARHAAS